ncbi:ABC-three component system protein [Ornithinibacillus californiensis]|uniref:ABC-three component system protein n=1 Tax=Ornithinibacillus californiensis TaxID=161536 RepID=UPI00069F7ED1|nr:ABC-three component system protein [Ornithinibacillus californiensis]
MSINNTYIIRMRFKLVIHESDGQAFENLFTKIMRKSNKNFELVKAYGNVGDMKNDGFDKQTGTYYQVFGPEDSSKKKTINDAVSKLRSDFEGLKKQWDSICPIKHFYFVVNDKYKGTPAPLIQEMIKLDNENKEIECKLFSAADLEDVLMNLQLEDVYDVIGFLPDANIGLLDFNILNEVIEFIMNSPVTFTSESKMVVPDFYEKIEFNGLSNEINDMLVSGSYSEGFLEDYFSKNSDYVRQELKQKFSEMYLVAKQEIPDDEEYCADKRFYYILEKSCPKHTKAVQDTVLVLMAHYFESCDIFEEPKGVNIL